jgi:hypothetical protein
MNISTFLTNMSADPQLKAQYKADPKGAATSAGLSPEDVSTLTSGDSDSITQAVRKENTHFQGGGPLTLVATHD